MPQGSFFALLSCRCTSEHRVNSISKNPTLLCAGGIALGYMEIWRAEFEFLQGRLTILMPNSNSRLSSVVPRQLTSCTERDWHQCPFQWHPTRYWLRKYPLRGHLPPEPKSDRSTPVCNVCRRYVQACNTKSHSRSPAPIWQPPTRKVRAP